MEPQTYRQSLPSHRLAMRYANNKLVMVITTRKNRFQTVLGKRNLPKAVRVHLDHPVMLFELLKDKENYEFNAQTGELTICVTLCIGAKKIVKMVSLLLKKSVNNQGQL